MLPIPNHLHYQNSHQHLTLNTAGYPTTPPHISLPPDSLSPISPQYFSNQASQLNQSHLPLLNILSPFSKQLFPTYPHCQLPPAWMQLPQTTRKLIYCLLVFAYRLPILRSGNSRYSFWRVQVKTATEIRHLCTVYCCVQLCLTIFLIVC